MYRFSLSLIVITASLLSIFPAYAAKEDASNQIQDTNQAAQYFQQELNFKTNPHGVNRVINGDVKNVTIIDLRLAKDFEAGHIPGAINMPYDKYNNYEGNQTTYPLLRKDGYNYVYCYDALCNLGQIAAVKFAKAGYPVKEIAGGFNSWKEAGNTVEK